MNIYLQILMTLLMLSILILLHEFGHYIAAKKCGVYVIEFAIGMGPRLFSKKGKETRFSVRALPIGGFCRMYGEADGTDANEDDDLPEIEPSRSFQNISGGRRFLILIAGVTMNFLFALVLIFIVYLAKGASLGKALLYTPQTAFDYGTVIFQSLGQLISGQLGLNDFAGPVGMVSMVGDTIVNYGFVVFLLFMAYISVNLGVINLLPFPALDGGQALLVIIEGITRKKIDSRIVGWINFAGLALLMGLMLVITANDVLKLI